MEASEILNFIFILQWVENNLSNISTKMELVKWPCLLAALP